MCIRDRYGVPHGMANAVVLPYGLEFNSQLREVKKQYDELSSFVGQPSLVELSLIHIFPHTNNTYVNKPAIGVVIPSSPVKFCAMGTKEQWLDCEVVIPLVIKDSRCV